MFNPPKFSTEPFLTATDTTSSLLHYPGGVGSLPPRDKHRLCAGLTRLLGVPPPRFLCELMIEAAEKGYDLQELLDRLDRYAAVRPEVLRAVGGDQFPPRTLRILS